MTSVPGNDLQHKTRQSKCLSTDSVQSSSGVSSTGSLHLSIGSEFDPVSLSGHNQGPCVAGVVTIGVPGVPGVAGGAAANTPPIPPRGNHHVSTTYITQDSVIVRGLSGGGAVQSVRHTRSGGNRSDLSETETMAKTSTKILHGKSDKIQPKVQGDANLDRCQKPFDKIVHHHKQNPEITINIAETKDSPVNISTSSQKPEIEVKKLRDILLKDSSVETS